MIDQMLSRSVLGEAFGLTTSTRVFVRAVVFDDQIMPLAALCVDVEHGTVELVGVEDDVRGRGLARQLLAHTRKVTGLPLDRASREISERGRRWCQVNDISLPEDPVVLAEREAEACKARLFMALYGPGCEFRPST